MGTVGLSVTVPFVRSEDVPPFFVDGAAELGDVSAAGRARNGKAWERWEECAAGLKAKMERKLVEAGVAEERAKMDGPFLSGQNYVGHDLILQLGVPGLFHPRADWPEQFRWLGVLPSAEEPAGGWANLPAWWAEVTEARTAGKKVVVVAQGTVEVDPNDLIVPTMRAMASRLGDVLVVAILGRKGAVLPAEVDVPANARVTDYLHYDAVLPHASAWVHNGGYGALQHGIAHGVPMVVTGEGQDKLENAKRIAWSGAGVNLGAVAPEVEKVRTAVTAVLDDEGFKRRIEGLQRESDELSCFDSAEKEFLKLMGLGK